MDIDEAPDRLWWAVLEQCIRDCAARDEAEREEAIDWLRQEAAPVLAAEYGIDAGAVDRMIDARSRRENRYVSQIAAHMFATSETSTQRGRLRRSFCPHLKGWI